MMVLGMLLVAGSALAFSCSGEARGDVQEHPTALSRAPRDAADHPGNVALRAQGAAIPMDPRRRPATEQDVPREEPDAAERE